MNRPDALNAFDDDLHGAFPTALREVSHDPTARAVVLTGAGQAFSAGGNVDGFAALASDLELRRSTLRLGRQLFEDLINVHLPVIAAVNGPAVGLGCTIATACDVVTHVGDGLPGRPARAGGAGRGGWRGRYLAAQHRAAARQAVPADRGPDAGRGGGQPGPGHPCRAGPTTYCPRRIAMAQRIAALPAAGRTGHESGAEPAPPAGRRHDAPGYGLAAESQSHDTAEYRAVPEKFRSRKG